MPADAILVIAVSAVVGTTVLLAIGLAAGYWAGLQAAERSDTDSSEELKTLKTDHANCQAQLANLNTGIRASHELGELVGLLAQSARPPLSSDLSEAIDCMIRNLRTLEQTIHTLLEPQADERRNSKSTDDAWEKPLSEVMQPPQHSLRVVDEDDAADATLSAQEMSDLMGGRDRLGESTLGMESRRYPYDCIQQLAPWADDEPMPDRCDYTGVRCQDISVHGISFLWDPAPHFTRAILSIGLPEAPMFMVVEVVRFKSVFKHGRVCHLVETAFVNRLERAADESEMPECASV